MDLRSAYLVLREIRLAGKDNDNVKDFKRRLRQQVREEILKQRIEWHYLDDEGQRRRRFVEVLADEQDYAYAKEEGLDINRYLEQQFWHNGAERICSDYDCTGLWFTSSVYVARISGNRFKLVEIQHLDV